MWWEIWLWSCSKVTAESITERILVIDQSLLKLPRISSGLFLTHSVESFVRMCQAVRMSLYGRPGACYIDLLAGCAFVSGCEDESVWSTWRLLH